MSQAVYLCDDGLTACSAISHGFFTRRGGVSPKPFDSLNTAYSSGDEADYIDENRRRVAQALGAEHLITVSQIHSAHVHEVSGPWTGPAPQGDAIVTTKPGIALGIMTADCVPVLLCDPSFPIIGAAHCGWQGTKADIVEAVVEKMCALGAKREAIVAAVGPAIAQDSYEVGGELRDAFLASDETTRAFFKPGKTPTKWQFALDRLVVAKLKALGLGSIGHVETDTYSNAENFFSYRRSTHEKVSQFGRQISAIAIRS